MDTDFHYVISIEAKIVHAANKPISIGKNNWIAGYNVVKKGAVTPVGTIVAGPYSMIGKDYTKIINPYTIIGGSPTKPIAEGYRRISNAEIQWVLYKYFKDNGGQYQFTQETDLDISCALPQS